MALFKGIEVRVADNGCGFDKQSPVTGDWSVLLSSSFTLSECNELKALFDTEEDQETELVAPIPPKPKGAVHFFKGAWHKIGDHNRVYIHVGTKWLSSSKSIAQYNREAIKQTKEYIKCQY
jgi:hypothetical protein